MFRDTLSVFEKLVCNHVAQEGPLATECWVWQKSCCNKGYGFMYFYEPGTGKRYSKRAHIVSWVMANGSVNADMTLDHRCRNTKCIRPSHLEEVSRPENTRRGNRARVRKKHTARTTTVTYA